MRSLGRQEKTSWYIAVFVCLKDRRFIVRAQIRFNATLVTEQKSNATMGMGHVTLPYTNH